MAKYFLHRDGAETGPVEAETVLQQIKEGELRLADMCWTKGMEKWQPIEEAFPKFVIDPLREALASESSVDSIPKYFLHKDGAETGPMEPEAVLQKIREGEIGLADMCWTKGMEKWQPIEEAFPKLAIDPFREVGTNEVRTAGSTSDSREAPRAEDSPTSLPASEPALPYQTYDEVPWYRRSSVNSLFILAHFLTCGFVPLLIWTCVNLLTGEIYFNKSDEAGNLKVWSTANKVVAVLILVGTIFYYAAAFIGAVAG